jgi:TRAP-type C4-dicarboxylate transport system substrate-binding protein
VQRPLVESRFAKQGLKVLFAVPWPPQGIYSAKPLASAADLKGTKWRAYNPATSKIAELVGAQPVTIQAAELAQAAATGGVQSLMTSGATGFDTKLYESLKFYYDTQAWLPKNLVFVSQKAFDALDKPTQEALLKAAAEAEARGTKVSQEKTQWYLDQLKAKGMTVAPPPAALAADMKKVGEILTADWLKKAGADGEALVAAFRK